MVTVRVPATSANLGPGFDVLGLALPLYNRLTLAASDELRIHNEGPEADGLPSDASHLAYQAAKRLCKHINEAVPVWEMTMEVAIPQSRGLGSSSAAIVSGLLASNAWFGNPLDTQALLELATSIEGHPDNVAPALFGGMTAAFTHERQTHCLVLTDKTPITLVLAIPNFKLSTAEARGVLPSQYGRSEVIANLASVTLLTTVMLKGNVEWLPYGLTDSVHQPYRFPLITGAESVTRAARQAGALGTVISGAGPTLLSFAQDHSASDVARAMESAWRSCGVESRTLIFSGLAEGGCVESPG